jgi:Kef-type K+ transport system membrane component KefB/predicted transcriptional regulator
MIQSFDKIIFALGVAYLAALFVARFIIKLRVPRVTGYLLVGILLGPSFSHILMVPSIIDADSLKTLRIVSEVSLALIMFTIGTQFRGEHFRKRGKRIFTLSCFEIGTTVLLVGLAIFAGNYFLFKSFRQVEIGLLMSSLQFAVFIAIIAVATAPAATLLVIREYNSAGPVTDIVLALVGLNNFISILAFNVASYFLLHHQGTATQFMTHLLAPLVFGAAIGFFISFWAQELESDSELQLLLLGGITGYVGIALLFHIDLFLGCFAAGIVLTNASPKADKLMNVLQRIDYPLYVIFFIVAGASLHLQEFAHLGYLGATYIAMRTLGKFVGNWLGAKFGGFGDIEKKYIGFAMLAQAGVAIGLSQALAKSWAAGGETVQTLILGSVVVFEIIGPISVRYGLVHAGEVPVLNLLAKRATENAFEGLHHILEHFRAAAGIPLGHKLNSPADILVKHVMRKNVETIHENTPFNDLLQHIAHSRYDRFPITDENNHFVGLIDYADIRDVIFDASLTHLVLAKDIMKPKSITLTPEQTLGEVLSIFRQYSNITFLPVLEGEGSGKLVGIISQNDVLAAFRSRRT